MDQCFHIFPTAPVTVYETIGKGTRHYQVSDNDPSMQTNVLILT